MEYQEQVDGDKVFTGDVEILGNIKNRGLSRLATTLQKSRAEAQSAKAEFQKFWEAILADGIIEPTEKLTLARTWAEIKTEYPIIRQRAIDIGMSTSHAYLVAFESSYSALVALLDGEILVHMDQDSIVDPVEVNSAFEDYQDARETLVSGTIETARDEAILISGENVADRTPSYFGPVEYPGQPPEPWKKSDKFLSFSGTEGDAYRGVFKLVEVDDALVWTRTVDPGDVEPAIRDIADICSRRDDAGVKLYGEPEDYGVSSISIAHIRLGLIDTLKADEVEVRGTIRAERGYFKGQIEAPPIKTEAAQVPGIITPGATHWKGSQFLAAISGIANGTYAASGDYDDKTVSGVKKGTDQNYHYTATEQGPIVEREWSTRETFTASVVGLVKISFQARRGLGEIQARILKNNIQIAAINITSSEYTECSATVIVAAGDEIKFQVKCTYILWVGSSAYAKDFRVSVASNTCGIDFTGDPSQVIETDTYYTTEGTIEIASESISFNAGWMKGYFIGTALQAALQAAGGSVWQLNEFEPNGWSETYAASITNYFSGKSCTAYEIQDTGVVLHNTDGSTTLIEYSTMYAYSASNKLYPASRNARFTVGGYRHETGSPISIHRIENTNPMEDNSMFSVVSLNSPERNHDPLAKFESTWAKTVKWYETLYHEFVSDDSFHNLVEENFSETIAHDASLKRFTRISGNFHTFLDDVDEFEVSGYSGAYIGNNGIYRGLDVHTLYVTYTSFEGTGTPVDAPAQGGITLGKETFAGSTTKISINASTKRITRSAGTFSRNLIGVGEYLFLYGFQSPYSANNGMYRIVEFTVGGGGEAVLKYDVTMGTTPVDASNIPGILVRYPIRHVHAILNFGNSTYELHKPRVQWGYQKGDGAYEFGMEYSHATKRGYFPNGRKVSDNVHEETTSGDLFTALDAALTYVGEEIILHGALSYVADEVEHIVTVSYAKKTSATVIDIYGLDGADLGGFSATSGNTDDVTVSISW